jgi:hypothetical protein
VGILGFLLPQVTTFLANASHFAIKKRVTNARQISGGPASAAFSLAIYRLAAFTLFHRQTNANQQAVAIAAGQGSKSWRELRRDTP